MKYRLAVLLLILGIIGGMRETVVYALNSTDTINTLEQSIDGVLNWKAESYDAGSWQALEEDFLSSLATTGGTDWYLIAMGRYTSELTYSKYLNALDTGREQETLNVSDRIRISMTYLSLIGSWCLDGLDDEQEAALITERLDYIKETRAASVTEEGITSHIYGLLLSTCLDQGSMSEETKALISDILAVQLTDGGFALYGENADPDVTAMVIQALAPYRSDSRTKEAISRAVTFLSEKQLTGGDYASWGMQNMETGAQVIIALCSLDEDPLEDERFIKDGNDLLDGILQYRAEDGSFSHTLDGAANNTSSVQAMLAFIALWRQQKGMTSLFAFDEALLSDMTVLARESGADNNGAVTAEDEQNTASDNAASTAAEPTKAAFVTEPIAADSASVTEAADVLQTEQQKSITGSDIKKILLEIVAAIVVIFIIFWLFRREKKAKTVLMILLAGSILSGLIWFSDIQTKDEYYQSAEEIITEDSKTVTISISAAVLLDDESIDKNSLSLESDGYLLEPVKVLLNEGDSVYSLLERAVRSNQLTLETSGSASNPFDTIYVKAISSIREKEYGDLSGWMYSVNKEFPSVSCTEYFPEDNDTISWVYSLNLGKDVSEP